MTFNKIVWKMAKYHYKKYIFYLVCNILAVMFFFMFTTIYFNEYIEPMKELGRIQHELIIPGGALIIFTVFFITYAHHLFMKRRRSEFGLFMTLGMTKRDIIKLILLENAAIAILSLIIGLLLGTIFSRLFFWLLLTFLGIQDISYHLSANMFVYSIVAFLSVFMIALGQSLYLMIKRNIIENLKSDETTENVSNKNAVIGGIGILVVIGSIVGIYYTAIGAIADGYLILWTLTTFMGLYIALYQFTSFIIELLKKNKSFYYRRLLYLTNLDYKYKQLTSIMMLATVMIMVTLLYSTIVLSVYVLTEKEAIESNPFDVGYMQTETKNNVAMDNVYSVFEQHGNKVQEHISVPVYSYFQESYFGDIEIFSLMSVEAFNEITSSELKLQDDEFIYLLNDVTKMGDDPSTPYDHGLRLPSDGDEVLYDLKEVVLGRQVNALTTLSQVVIFNQTELERLKQNLGGIETIVHLINLEDWQESEVAVNNLEQIFKDYNAKTPTIDVGDIIPEDDLFQIASRVDGYENAKKSNGVVFLVTIFLSILFFVGTFSLLYIQLFSNVDKEVDRIHKLHRIGITSKELKKLISQEVTTIFMIPMLLGTILALFYIVMLTADTEEFIPNPEFLLNFFIIGGIYFLFQFIFLFYARKKMFRQLTN